MEQKMMDSGAVPGNHSMVVKLEGGRTFNLSFEHLLSQAMCLQEKRALAHMSAARPAESPNAAS